ncbi:MAG: hypothetical protein HYU66_09815 [Armatimonadetes bacterium]|nr:hypothetical protein [Armatimonadota bacterium]
MLALALCLSAVSAGPLPVGVSWTVVDLAAQRSATVADQPASVLGQGRLERTFDELGIALRVEHWNGRLLAHLRDLSGKDRGLTLRLPLDLPPGDWRWNTTGLRELPGLPEFGNTERPDYGRYSAYPLGAVNGPGGWLALARPAFPLELVRFSAVGGTKPRLIAEVDLALSEFSDPPREADLELRCGSGEEASGLRSALPRLTDLPVPRVKQFGAWMPFWDLAKLPNVDEFGFAYQEGAPNAAFDDALGALSFVYFHCAGEFANVPGYQRGTDPEPPYEQVVAAFNRVAEEHSGVAGAWDACGLRDAAGKLAYRKERTYGDFFCQACVDPELPYGQAMAERLLARVQTQPVPQGIDGVYYDGIAAGLDYDPRHLKSARHLLLWDGKLGRPVSYNLWSSVAWAKAIHDKLEGTGKLTMLNDSSLVSFTFAGPVIDVPGAEMGINLTREQARLIRALVGRNPFCTLVKADFNQVSEAQIETYMRRCLAYAILPGFFDISPSGDHPGSSYWEHPEWYDRDRPVFRRYLPLCRELAESGWQPETQAGTGAPAERFGPRAGLTYVTFSTDPGPLLMPQPITVSPTFTRPGDLAVELLTGRVEPAPVPGAPLVVPLVSEDLSVWSFGSARAQAAACVGRARDLLDGRARYLRAVAKGGETLTPWGPYMEQGATVAAPGHDSAHCLQVERKEGQGHAGATQTITVNHDRPRKLLVSAWSRAEGVTGQQDRDYAVYVDCYYTDGSAIYGQTIPFATGTHDWQPGELTIEPAKPIRNINVYLLFRGNHLGRAWFDDVRVRCADEPERELLPRGGFESEGGRPLAQGDAAAERVNAPLAELARRLAATPPRIGAADVEPLLSAAQTAAKEAGWGPDTDRTLRDVEELRWHLALARASADRKVPPPVRGSRLTRKASLAQPAAPQAGPLRYRADAGKMPAGTLVSVDSNFDNYTPVVLTDGRVNPESPDWWKVAWASAETNDAHWVELRFPAAVARGTLRVWWARDGGRLYRSPKLALQVPGGAGWRTVAEGSGEPASLDLALPAGSWPAVRVWQPAGGGPPERPELMWITELEWLPWG